MMRLDKLLSHCGLGTRKEVKQYIRKGYVTINDIVIKKDDFKVNEETDIIKFDDEPVIYRKYVYIMLNKPAGYISATKDNCHPTVLELVEGYDNYELFPVGRLDIDTEGFLLLSNDGDFAHRLLAPSRNHDKKYIAHIDKPYDASDSEIFLQGVTIDTGYTCKPALLKLIENQDDGAIVEVIIQEGKFHQVKKMFEAINKNVVYLKRIQIRSIDLDETLELGEYRELNDDEIVDLMNDL